MCDLYDLYIFDLDHTLILHSSNPEYRKEYETQLVKFLHNLKNHGKILALITYNSHPHIYLENLKINHLFSYIYHPCTTTLSDYLSTSLISNATICIRENMVTLYKEKYIVIYDLLDMYNINKDKAIFFDDNHLHVNSVKKLGIKSILVDPLKGIPFTLN